MDRETDADSIFQLMVKHTKMEGKMNLLPIGRRWGEKAAQRADGRCEP